ncbi:MAG: hypothetical protein WCL00_03665 [Bacteroidota bacterium]
MAKKVIEPFSKRLGIFTLSLGAISAILYLTLPYGLVTKTLPFLFLLFMMVTGVTYYMMYKSVKKRAIKFVNSYLIATIAKLLVYITTLMVYIMNNRDEAIPFAAAFFFLYLFYSIYEVVELIYLSKRFNAF